jgi:hypothetical protein
VENKKIKIIEDLSNIPIIVAEMPEYVGATMQEWTL